MIGEFLTQAILKQIIQFNKPILIEKLANVDQADAYLMILDAYKKNKYITTKDQDDHYDGQVITIKNG